MGHTVGLTAKEFELLWCCELPPRPFSTCSSWPRCGEYEDAPGALGTSTVTVHVRRLREKIEQDPSKPQIITTVWGVGYRFEP